ETRVSDAILAVDEPIRATRCKSGSAIGCRSNKSRCLTHDLWEELGNQIHIFLSSVSLADVCNRRVLGQRRALAAAGEAGRPWAAEPPAAEPSAAQPSTPAPTPAPAAAE